jgi:AcrR family transcriptional regulator
MPPVEPGGWEKRRAQTRVALAEAAVRLFRDRGYDATTVEDIAEAANSSSSTFFRYFKTKEDVLFLNIREIQDRFHDFLAEPIPNVSCWEQIHQGITIGVREVADPSPEVEEASIRSWLQEPAVRGRFLELVNEMENTMAAALAAERGTDPNHDLWVQLAARTATAIYMAAFQLHISTGQDLVALVDDGFEMVAPTFAPDIPSAEHGDSRTDALIQWYVPTDARSLSRLDDDR